LITCILETCFNRASMAHAKRIRGIAQYALYKFTIYLLTYLQQRLTSAISY